MLIKVLPLIIGMTKFNWGEPHTSESNLKVLLLLWWGFGVRRLLPKYVV